MMATFLVKILKEKVEKSPDKTLAYLFCDDKIQDRRTPTAILRSLVWQLLLQNNRLFRHVHADFEKHKENRLFEELFENFSALWRIFQDMLRDEGAGEVFILIDALDECDRFTRKALLLGIRELSQSSPRGRLKFLITCRPEISDIEYELDGVGFSLRMDASEVNSDLSNYLDVKVRELAERKRYSPELESDVKRLWGTEPEVPSFGYP